MEFLVPKSYKKILVSGKKNSPNGFCPLQGRYRSDYNYA